MSPSPAAASKLERGRPRRPFPENSRDQRDFQLAARPERHPGGGARAGMDEIDSLGRENACEPAHVEGLGDGILARGGKGNMQASDRLHFAREHLRLAGDERPRARIDQRRGDRQRRPLVAAGGARRHDLQDGAARERLFRRASEGGKGTGAHLRLRPGGARLTRNAASAKPAPSRRHGFEARASGRIMRMN